MHISGKGVAACDGYARGREWRCEDCAVGLVEGGEVGYGAEEKSGEDDG